MSFGLPNKELWPFYLELLRSPEDARGNWRPSRECFTSWPSTFQRGEFSSYLSRRIVPSINIPYVYSEKNFWSFDKPIWYCSHATECLTHLCSCEFFLDLWGRSLCGPLIRALRLPVRLHSFVWISPSLSFCDHLEIESKSSWFRCLSPCHLVASNLGRYNVLVRIYIHTERH